MNVINNYRRVVAAIEETARSCGRNPADITLVAVTKQHIWEHIKAAYAAGCRNFGESRLQEALPKIAGTPEDIHWHLIGTLQKNKVTKVIGTFALIHSVDSFELAEKISDCGLYEEIETRILLQVNVLGEESKHGLTPDELRQTYQKFLQLPSIKVEGLMTMAPFVENERVIRDCFARLRDLRDELRFEMEDPALLPELSMGMSHDYPIAIQEGATIVRVGTAIFGED